MKHRSKPKGIRTAGVQQAGRTASPVPRIWHDMTTSLFYSAVLGSVIYAFVDAVFHQLLLPAIGVPDAVTGNTPPSFFAALGFSPTQGSILYFAISLATILHFCFDFLYSKYSQPSYAYSHFFGDLAISLLLAFSYAIFSSCSARDLAHIRISFAIFWGSLFLTYMLFLWWDLAVFRSFPRADDRDADFYRRMVYPYEAT